MNKILSIFLVLVISLTSVFPVFAEQPDIKDVAVEVLTQVQDVTRLKPALDLFFKILKNSGNIMVVATFACGGRHKADWIAAWVKVIGFFIWTDGVGLVHIHGLTADPPMGLNLYGITETPGITAGTADIDVDGNIPLESPGYRPLYRRWLSRPCVDLGDMLLNNPKLARLWQKCIEATIKINKVYRELEALGFDPRTGVPEIYMITSNDLITNDKTLDQLLKEIEFWPDYYNVPRPADEPQPDYFLETYKVYWVKQDNEFLPVMLIGAALLVSMILCIIAISVIVRRKVYA